MFTHDTIFLGELLDQIEQQNVASVIHYLEWANNNPGCVNKGLPWGHQGYKERLDILKKNCNRIKKTWPTCPNEDDRARVCQQYSYLRSTVEELNPASPGTF